MVSQTPKNKKGLIIFFLLIIFSFVTTLHSLYNQYIYVRLSLNKEKLKYIFVYILKGS